MPRNVPRFALYDVLLCTMCVKSPCFLNSSSSHVRTKKPRSSSFFSSSIRTTPSIAVLVKRIESDHFQLRYRNNKLSSRVAILLLLREYLVREVPRKEQREVGLVLKEFLRRIDWKASAGCVSALLCGAAIYDVFDSFPSDA